MGKGVRKLLALLLSASLVLTSMSFLGIGSLKAADDDAAAQVEQIVMNDDGEAETAKAENPSTVTEKLDINNEPEEMKMPAQSFRETGSNGVLVCVSAPAGVLPEGTEMQITAISDSRAMKYAERAVGETAEDAKAVDISFYINGEEIEPRGEVEVRISGTDLEGDSFTVAHVSDDGTVDTVGKATSDGAVFSAAEFSVYLVIGVGENETPAACTYIFKMPAADGGNIISKQIVRDGQTLKMPEAPQKEGSRFIGWFDGDKKFQDFGVQHVASTGEKTLTARFSNPVYVYFVDTEGRICATREGRTGDVVSADVQIKINDFQTAGEWFTDRSCSSESRVSEITLGNEDVYLYTRASEGNWITFETTGGSSVDSEFVAQGGKSEEPDAIPHRSGYRFGGWYTDQSCISPFEFGDKLALDITLYAKWIPAESRYTVVYLVETPDGSGYKVNKTETKTGITGAAAEYDSKGLAGEDIYKYIKFSRADENVTINGDGSSVVKVYYDRNEYTLRFIFARKTGSIFQISSSTTYTNNVVRDSIWVVDPDFDLSRIPSGYETEERGIYTYYYYTITAKYGASIRSSWPLLGGYEDSFSKYISWGTQSPSTYKNTLGGGNANIKGPYSMMDEHIIVNASNPETVHEMVAYWNSRPNTYIYNIIVDGVLTETYSIRSTSVASQQSTLSFPGWKFDRREYVGGTTKDSRGGTINFYYTTGEYEVSFNNPTEEKTVSLKYGASLENLNYTPEAPEGREHCVFGGWYEDESCAGDEFFSSNTEMPDGPVQLYAKWIEPDVVISVHDSMETGSSATEYTVKYGGKLSEALNAEGQNIVLPDGAVGWATYKKITGRFVPWDGKCNLYRNIDIYPVFTDLDVSYRVKYDSNGAAGTVKDGNRYAGMSFASVKSATELTPPGDKVFLGWNTAADGSGSMYQPNQSIQLKDSDITLYAQWGEKPEKTRLAYNFNQPAGSVTVSEPVTYDNNEKITVAGAPDPIDGYIFTGWNTAADGSGQSIEPGASVRVDTIGTEDGVNYLYAQWRGKDRVTVTITGHTDSAEYDGEIHSAIGYEWTSDSDLYTEDDFDFHGSAVAASSEAGTTSMNLKPEQFTNINSDYDVVFKVTDGYVSISRADISVEVTGNSETAEYDGQEHVVSGFNVHVTDCQNATADRVAQFNSLYSEDDITYDGAAETRRTDAGVSYMHLDSTRFRNKNHNFKVSVSAEDGFIRINPYGKVIVNVAGNDAAAKYNGSRQTVQGYRITDISTKLYKASYIGFRGRAEASGIDAGKYEMNLSSQDFYNTSGNFSNVEFRVKDGSLVIKPRHVVLRSADATKSYDGTPLTSDTIEVGGDGFAPGEGFLYQFTGSQTEVGSSANTFKYTMNPDYAPGDLLKNYVVETEFGTLTVTEAGAVFVPEDPDHGAVTKVIFDEKGRAKTSVIAGKNTPLALFGPICCALQLIIAGLSLVTFGWYTVQMRVRQKEIFELEEKLNEHNIKYR